MINHNFRCLNSCRTLEDIGPFSGVFILKRSEGTFFMFEPGPQPFSLKRSHMAHAYYGGDADHKPFLKAC